jgi:hypothetical protein
VVLLAAAVVVQVDVIGLGVVLLGNALVEVVQELVVRVLQLVLQVQAATAEVVTVVLVLTEQAVPKAPRDWELVEA